jgi:predicted nucleotidyltransferase
VANALNKYAPWTNLETVHDSDRKKKALDIAKKSAGILRNKFGIDRLWIIGSLANNDQPFTTWSDINLVVDGLDSSDFWKAGARLDQLTDDYHIDLIATQHAKPTILEKVKQEGKEI